MTANYEDVLSPRNSSGNEQKQQSQSAGEELKCSSPTGKAWLETIPQPPLKLPYFYVKKNTCLEAMPTLSVWGKRVPSLTQGQNYAWQPSPAAQQAGLYTIPSFGMGEMGGGGNDPQRSCQEVVRSQSSSLEVQCLQTASLSALCARRPSLQGWVNPLLTARDRASSNGHTRHHSPEREDKAPTERNFPSAPPGSEALQPQA